MLRSHQPQQYDAVVKLLGDIQTEATQNAPHDPGHVTIRRLNRAEYNNTIRDLLGIDFHPADDFPADDVGYGFDNNGDVLSLTPLLLEKYLTSAEKAVNLALEHDPAKSPSEPYRRIMIADPSKLGPAEAARQIIRRFADRAYRRPIDDEDLNRLMQLFAATNANQPFEQKLQPVLTAILVSPRFSVPRRNSIRRPPIRKPRARSTIGNSPRAYRISCGAACPTTNFSISPAAANCALNFQRKCVACCTTQNRKHWSKTSPTNGSKLAG